MSINHFVNKIKAQMGIDTKTLIFVFVVIGVGVASFGLGELSAKYNMELVDKSNNFFVSENNNSDIEIIDMKDNIISDDSIVKEKVYVASKNGKLYYSIGCGNSSRIKEENKIYFKTKEDAEKSGYILSSSCK